MMKPPSEEPRFELDLDNRKLIIGFALLMALFAGFFVFGFVEGKRQALQNRQAGAVEAAASEAGAPGTEVKPAPAATPTLDEKKVSEQLDWYKNVNSRAPVKVKKTLPQSAPERSGAAAPKAAASQADKAPQPSAGAGRISYTVQVGAFRQLQEAQRKAAALKAKGYASYIDPPKAPNDYYLLKVGRFDSRATAIEMQLRLKKDGFTTLIKSN